MTMVYVVLLIKNDHFISVFVLILYVRHLKKRFWNGICLQLSKGVFVVYDRSLATNR